MVPLVSARLGIAICGGLLLAAVVPRMGGGQQAGPATQAPGEAREFYAAPEAGGEADGSIARPLPLAAALSGNSPVLPGDTLWLRGGTYRGTFVSELRGTERAPVTVRAFPGERVTIDGGSSSIVGPALYVKGEWTTYWGFEVMSSEPTRVLTESGSQPKSLKRGVGIDVHGPHTRFVNLIVHDAADGLGVWADAEGAEVYGNIVYHNGWEADDRAHGHGIYTQNRNGQRLIAENIVFDQFSHGIHAYGSDAAWLDHISLVGNVVFNNGALDDKYYDRNILLGGQRRAVDPVVDSNYTYYTPVVRHGGENNLGYNAGCVNLRATNNYFAGQLRGGNPLALARDCDGVIRGNVFFGPMAPWIGQAYPENTYLIEPPTGTKVFVRRNRYEPSRSNVIVYNWDRLPELELDLSAAEVDPDVRFALHDAQNIFGPPLVEGTFGSGRIKVPLRGLKVAAPVGNIATPVHTAPEFAVFVLTASAGDSTSHGLSSAISHALRRLHAALAP